MTEVSERTYQLKLYVTGTTARSVRAISNARRICEAHYANDYDLEVVDLYLHPAAAQDHQIIAAPTLLKMAPAPSRRIIGDLSDERKALAALGIEVQKNGASSND